MKKGIGYGSPFLAIVATACSRPPNTQATISAGIEQTVTAPQPTRAELATAIPTVQKADTPRPNPTQVLRSPTIAPTIARAATSVSEKPPETGWTPYKSLAFPLSVNYPSSWKVQSGAIQDAFYNNQDTQDRFYGNAMVLVGTDPTPAKDWLTAADYSEQLLNYLANSNDGSFLDLKKQQGSVGGEKTSEFSGVYRGSGKYMANHFSLLANGIGKRVGTNQDDLFVHQVIAIRNKKVLTFQFIAVDPVARRDDDNFKKMLGSLNFLK